MTKPVAGIRLAMGFSLALQKNLSFSVPFPFVIGAVVFAEPEPLRLFAWNRTELRLGSYICSIGGKYFLRYFPAGKRIGHYFLKYRKMRVFLLGNVGY